MMENPERRGAMRPGRTPTCINKVFFLGIFVGNVGGRGEREPIRPPGARNGNTIQ